MEQTIENEIVDSNGKNVEWFEESLEVDLKWSLAINSVLYKATTKFQDVILLDTKHFGKEVVNICRKHLMANQEAFADCRLHVIINDAKVELEKSDEYKYDVIVGDLCDPREGGPCNHLYLKSFYQHIIKPKLNHNGVFVTQAGFAGVLSHQAFFSSVYNTAKQVFNHVIAYTAHVPSLADTRGWVLASDQPLKLDAEVINNRIKERIKGSDLQFIDAAFMLAFTVMNKTVHTTLMNETNVLTEENEKSLHGH
uniref:ACAULIS5 protein n=1 Tax=Solanum tuberosum TaxID=4113 RepID=M1BQ51_SOLTU